MENSPPHTKVGSSGTTTSSENYAPEYLKSWKLGVVIACLFCGDFLIAIDTTIINVAIPKISSDFHSLQDVAWYGTAYLITLTAFQPIYGTMYKSFNIGAMYRTSIVVFEVGTILCAAATTSSMFIVGRAIAGIGAAGVLQGALSIIGQVVELEKRPLYMGIVISVFIFAVCIGPPLGGVFTQNATWRWCFWINLPIGAVALILLWIFLKVKGTQNEHRRASLRKKLDSMDPLSCVIFVATICCLLLALQWGGQTKPWNSPTVIALLVLFVLFASLFSFLLWRREDRALIPFRILKKRSIWTGAIVLFFLGASNYVNVFFLPFYFQAVYGVDPIKSGEDFIPLLLSAMVSLIIVGALVKTWGHYVPYMIVGEFVCIIGTALLTQLTPSTPTVLWATYLVVSGIGMGMAMQLPYTAVQITLNDEDIPIGNAIAVLFYQLGGAIAISMGQTITIITILDEVTKLLPDVSSEAVITAGAANIQLLVTTTEDLKTLRLIWNTAISRTMILSTALVAASAPFTLGMEWLNAKKVAEERKNKTGTQAVERRADEEIKV